MTPADSNDLHEGRGQADGRTNGRTDGQSQSPARQPLIVNPHRKLPVWLWVIPLVIIVAAIVLLPHLLERFI